MTRVCNYFFQVFGLNQFSIRSVQGSGSEDLAPLVWIYGVFASLPYIANGQFTLVCRVHFKGEAGTPASLE